MEIRFHSSIKTVCVNVTNSTMLYCKNIDRVIVHILIKRNKKKKIRNTSTREEFFAVANVHKMSKLPTKCSKFQLKIINIKPIFDQENKAKRTIFK